jgi:hypothetical protein
MGGERSAEVPAGNLEPAILARFVVQDFTVAWDAVCECAKEQGVGGNFMFARQAFAYLELAARTASRADERLERFASFLADRDARYFTELPSDVPLPSTAEFQLPALPGVPAERQLLAALFDMSRHGLAHLYQQTPVDLSDGKQWTTTFTGAGPGLLMNEASSPERRTEHLSYRVGPVEGRIYLIVCPDVLLADLQWAASLAPIFSQYLTPDYPTRPRRSRGTPRARSAATKTPYAFSSVALIDAFAAHGHPHMPWPETS